MPDYDAGFKIVARRAGRDLARLAGFDCDAWEPLTGEVQATERLADRVFKARYGGERCVVYMEAYTRWYAAAPWNLLAKSGLLSERERLPTLALVFILLPRGYRSQSGEFRLELRGETTQQLRYHEVCLWKVMPQPWWEQHPGILPLYPLCAGLGGVKDKVVEAAAKIRTAEREPIVRADYLTILGLFAKLANPALNAFDLIGRQAMKESKFYQEILEEGLEEGLRKAVREVLVEKFGESAAGEFAEALGLVHDETPLTRLVTAAVKARSTAAFKKAITAELKR